MHAPCQPENPLRIDGGEIPHFQVTESASSCTSQDTAMCRNLNADHRSQFEDHNSRSTTEPHHLSSTCPVHADIACRLLISPLR